jgi:E3 SUMO-protein ligase NSE2
MSHRTHGVLSGGARRSRASGVRRDEATPAAPTYEPLAHPLTAAAQRELAAVANSRDTRKYEAHLAKCANMLRASVGAVNDRLEERRQEAAAATRRRRDTEDGLPVPSASQVSVTGEALQELEADVTELTSKLEAAAREVIDLQAGLQDELAALGAVKDRIGQIPRVPRPRRHVDAEGGDDEELPDAADEEPIVNTRELLAQEREARKTMYAQLGVYEKYCRNNDYISFKKMLQDARDPDVPVPDPSGWFDEDGRPVLGRSVSGAGEKEELEVVGVKQSFRCPLTLAPLVQPLTSRKCGHTFEKEAILDFVRTNGPSVRCPQSGCEAVSGSRLCCWSLCFT